MMELNVAARYTLKPNFLVNEIKVFYNTRTTFSALAYLRDQVGAP